MNEIYQKYKELCSNARSPDEVEARMVREYAYTWQEIAEARIILESNNPNYWLYKNNDINEVKKEFDKQYEKWSINDATPADWDAVRPDMVNSPPHYTKGGIETIDFIKAKLSPEEYRGYLRGNLLKYASRMGAKGEDDAGKAAWYAQRLELL